MSGTHIVTRREFLHSASAGAALSAAVCGGLTAPARAAAESPNSAIRVAIVGLGNRGRSQIPQYMQVPGVDIVALCDVDQERLQQAEGELERETGRAVKTFVDFRALLNDPEIDVVSIATPNHWHALQGIWAMEAGKDVYVEKPCSHNIWEGRQLVRAARKYGRMCQHGTQGRPAPALREAMQKLRDGVIGEVQVYMARGLCFKRRGSIGRFPDEPVPSGVDYDLWLGPAPERPFNRNRFHYNWHWHWDYGNGDIGNQGVHEMDMARWGLGVGLPRKVRASGGRFVFDDAKETPNTLIATFEYPEQNKLLVFEVRHWHTNLEGTLPGTGVTFYGSEGYMQVRYFGYRTFLGARGEPGPSGESLSSEMGTFISGVRSRDVADLGVDVEEGHLSSALCHLANISYRLGRDIAFDPEAETCPDDEDASALLTRPYRSPFVVSGIT